VLGNLSGVASFITIDEQILKNNAAYFSKKAMLPIN